MPLHDRRAVSERLDDCVFAGHSLTEPVPKYRFPRHEMDPKAAVQVVSDELILDGNARQNLATFCQTWAEPEMLALMALAVNKNMIDKDEYPQTAEIEKRCAHMLADLRARGWQVPAYALTAAASDIAVQRILVRLGVSRDIASLLLDDFRNAVDHFAKHPVTVSMSKEESGGFSHA